MGVFGVLVVRSVSQGSDTVSLLNGTAVRHVFRRRHVTQVVAVRQMNQMRL